MKQLNKVTSCIATNEAHYGTEFNQHGIKLVVTKDATTNKVKQYLFFDRKGTTVKFRDILYNDIRRNESKNKKRIKPFHNITNGKQDANRTTKRTSFHKSKL